MMTPLPPEKIQEIALRALRISAAVQEENKKIVKILRKIAPDVTDECLK